MENKIENFMLGKKKEYSTDVFYFEGERKIQGKYKIE